MGIVWGWEAMQAGGARGKQQFHVESVRWGEVIARGMWERGEGAVGGDEGVIKGRGS